MRHTLYTPPAKTVLVKAIKLNSRSLCPILGAFVGCTLSGFSFGFRKDLEILSRITKTRIGLLTSLSISLVTPETGFVHTHFWLFYVT